MGSALARPVAGMLGMVNPAEEQAKSQQQVLQGADLQTPQGLRAAAQRFNQLGMPQQAYIAAAKAREMEGEQQKMMIERQKQALGERKQEFQETEAFDLKKTESMERLRLREKEIESQAEIARQRGEDTKQYRDAMVENRRMMLALAQSKQQGGIGKPPPGYRWTPDGNLEPIPGGPKDTSQKNKAIAETAAMKAKLVTNKVDEALGETGFFSTGLTGTVLGMVPGTSAYNLDTTLDTIKANIGFNELQAMRQASPTGGALGQVAVRELDMLQSTIASLKKGQSQDKLRKGLEQVKTHYSNWKRAVDQASIQEGAVLPSGGAGGKWEVVK